MKDEQVKMIKQKYPSGTRIRLIYMNDNYAVPKGTIGTVDYVDDLGQIQMNWDNGSSLALIYGIDKFEKLEIKNKEMER